MSAAQRAVPAALLTAVVLLAIVAGAVVGGPTGGAVGAWFEAASGRLSAGLGWMGAALPFGYAFAAGMLAAVNPCGFVLVPAYLGRYLQPDRPTPRGRLLLRALGFSGAVTTGFITLFATAGVVLGIIGAAIVSSLPWLGLAVGVLLVGTGALRLVGGPSPSLAAGEELGGRLAQDAVRPGLVGHAVFGLAYGLASLGCALPIFLTVVGGATTQSFLGAVGVLVLYGLGLGAVLSAAALAATALGTEVVARLGRVRRLVPATGAALLVLAGAYVTYYWLTAGGILARMVA
jgi:cytochrome c biogenesis protein CcdA